MRHSKMISHLYDSRCSVCLTIAYEFGKVLEKNWKLRTENEELRKELEKYKKEG